MHCTVEGKTLWRDPTMHRLWSEVLWSGGRTLCGGIGRENQWRGFSQK